MHPATQTAFLDELEKISGSGNLNRLRRRLGARVRELMPKRDVLAGKFRGNDPTLIDPEYQRLSRREVRREREGWARDLASGKKEE